MADLYITTGHSDRLYLRLAPAIVAAASRRASKLGLTLSAYVRRLIVRDLGLEESAADAARGPGAVVSDRDE